MESSKGRYPKWRTPKLVEDSPETDTSTGERRAWKLARGVRRGARGKGRCESYLACGLPYFVVLHPDLSELQQAARRIRQWLAKIGLQLNAHKTRIIHTLTPFQGQAGFDFLGFALRQYPGEKTAGKSSGFQTLLTPSDEASKRHLAVISQRLLKLQAAPQAQVIRELNPIIGGWAAYYNGLVSAEAMSRYDEQLEHLLMSWASKRHPNKARDWLLHRYWQRLGKREWTFTAPEGAQLRSYQRSNGQTR